ncbi:MAG: relaxase/mobilization nuclease domain-containing protein [Pseudomonadota bacterium]
MLNAYDNEYLQLADLRGSIACDLHGAFAEWEAEALAMTKAEKYLYSLSINPDRAQGPLTREQYDDYIARAEESLGLFGQPRATVFHIKEGLDANLREHCHVIWSRTDVHDWKAIHLPFDRQKLMMVTRAFAHDHGLKLPDGYQTGRAQKDQLSLYEKAQQDQTGLTKEERQELITELWHHSDGPKPFVNALEDNGYTLATGRRPYVLVDIYGHTNARPKMIDDKAFRTKDIRAFLEQDFPTELLPTVDEAKALAKAHFSERWQMQQSEKFAEQREMLAKAQEARQQKLAQGIEAKAVRHEERSRALLKHQQDMMVQLKADQTQQDFEIAFARTQKAPTGLAAFLAKVSGVAFVQRKLQAREDRVRADLQAQARQQLEAQQRKATEIQAQKHGLEMQELKRQETAQQRVFEREQRSLEMAQQREQAMHYRRGHQHMPAMNLTLTPGGRPAMPYAAKNRYHMQTAKETNVKANRPEPVPPPRPNPVP